MKSINNLRIPKNSVATQKSYSIVELSISLAIISLVLVGSLAGVQRVLRSNNVNKDLVYMNLIASKLFAANFAPCRCCGFLIIQ